MDIEERIADCQQRIDCSDKTNAGEQEELWQEMDELLEESWLSRLTTVKS